MHELHLRASRWFAEQGLLEEAIHQAMQGQDLDEAARLLATVPTDALWGREGISLFIKWGTTIPSEKMLRHPRALILLAVAHLFTGDIDRFNTLLNLCEEIASIRGEYALFKAIQLRSEGDFRQALQLAQEAGEILSEETIALQAIALMQIAANLLQLGELQLAEKAVVQARKLIVKADESGLDIHLQLIQIQCYGALMRADYHQAHRIYQEGLALAQGAQQKTPPRVGLMYTGLGIIHYEWNMLKDAEVDLTQARSWAERSGIFDILMHTLAGEIRLYCQQGNEAAVEPLLEMYDTYGHQGRYEHMTYLTESVVANFNMRLGRLEEAVRWANSSGFTLTDQPVNAQSQFYRIFATVRLAEYRILGHRDDLPQLLTLLDYLCQQAQTTHHQHDLIQLLILRALVFDYLSDQTAARNTLQQALTLAEPGGLIRTFLDAGSELAPLLAQCEGVYARHLYEAMQKEMAAKGQTLTIDPASLPFDLTPREYEVLQEIFAGLSNKQIEAKLHISHNTVRTHIKNLYSKLDVTSRTQAIVRARELQSGSATVKVNGDGQISIWVVDTLDADVSGDAVVSYFGSPQVQENVSGDARLVSADN